MLRTSKPKPYTLPSCAEDKGLIDRGSNKGPFKVYVGLTVHKYYGYLGVDNSCT